MQLDPAPDSATEADCGTGVYKITVDSGFSELTNDFINFELGTKGGYKYVDVDGDLATTDDQDPLNGWDINLYADDGLVPGTWDGSNTVLDTVTTGDGLWADGYYEFDGLAAGTYFVGEVCETGWIQLDPAPDSATEADCGTGVYKITVDSGFSELTNDFINFELGTKGGYKYVDVDGDLATTDDQWIRSTAGTSTSTPTTVSSPARGTGATPSSTPSPPVMASGLTATTSSTAWPPARTSSVRSARPAGSSSTAAPDSATEADCGTGVYKITVRTAASVS